MFSLCEDDIVSFVPLYGVKPVGQGGRLAVHVDQQAGGSVPVTAVQEQTRDLREAMKVEKSKN